MSHKSEDEYFALYSEVRTSLEAEFGNIGVEKTVMMDFEIAAHNAIRVVFPEWTIKTCYFHFFKNVTDQARKKGLTQALENVNFKRWLNETLGKHF